MSTYTSECLYRVAGSLTVMHNAGDIPVPVRNFICDARSSVACKQIVAEIAKKKDHCVMKLVKGMDLAAGEATFIGNDGGVDNE